MSYKFDKDLEFLRKCENEDLKDLFELLTRDPKDGKERLTRNLFSSIEFKTHGHNYKMYWKRIAEELQLYGGDTIANVIRGIKDFKLDTSGILYREILTDTAKTLKVEFNTEQATSEIEDEILLKLLLEIVDNASENEKIQILENIDENFNYEKLKNSYNKENSIPWKLITTSVIREIIKKGGFATYKLSLIVVNFVWKKLFGKGLTLVANKLLTKSISLLLSGPISVFLNIWLAKEITGPAKRITIPAVVLIATLRKKYKNI